MRRQGMTIKHVKDIFCKLNKEQHVLHINLSEKFYAVKNFRTNREFYHHSFKTGGGYRPCLLMPSV